MKLLPLALAASLLFSGTAIANGFDACEYESDFNVRIAPNALTFHRSAGAPAEVQMRSGRLFVDGRELALSAADRERVRRFEDAVRALVPEVKAIALEGVGIASEALTQVAKTFAGKESAQTLERMNAVTADLIERIQNSDDSSQWDEAEFERVLASLTAELVPTMLGDVTSLALQVALSGDESAVKALEERAEKMEAELEARIEKRAEALEARAKGLCPRVAELDALETSLELRLADNRPLDLLQRDR